MLAIISPAKTLDFETPPQSEEHSTGEFLQDSNHLIDVLRAFSAPEISALMKISSKLGDLNFQRYANWHLPFDRANAKQALLAFKGDVYLGLEAETLNQRDLSWLQNHLRILSGLYGVLRPLDLIQPYRLEMGTALKTSSGKNLYQFWGDKLTASINAALDGQRARVLVNLASKEYSQALKLDAVDGRVITPAFKDLKNGRYKLISFYAKKARGAMVRYMVKNRVSSIKALQNFDGLGYCYSEDLSAGDDWVFLRDPS